MTPTTPETVRRSVVAVIDDDEDLRLLLRHSLELRGFAVLEFDSTESALGWEDAELTGEPIPLSEANLILLDVNLPGISGIETIELIKETPSLRNIPIAMLSAHGEVEVVLRCVKSGANDYFVKPLDFPEVMRRIDRLLADPSGILYKSSQVQVGWNFQEYLVRELKRAERSEEPLGLLLGGVRRLSGNPDS
ncbi:MAG: response regulator, partial [Candidatus Omnitrophica bacterium]|nr:response regulator [Candidatus Omnitrophota bacterium]